ncbi:hypothetical protein BDQ12DRAFT_668565 [Crucibulum laeve]|uniref:Transferase n=1 Tax=Crucibulum laeve TaxID=68775 RepID=A0A5C3LU32_9AGAR|nr:hypothetical protein BDQ12DRAFT_668565 [Crucibulum laeve]
MVHQPFPEQYSVLTSNNMTQDAGTYCGLVVSGVLDVAMLETKHRELVSLWPVLGGKLVTTTQPYSFTTGNTVDFGSRQLSCSVYDLHLPNLRDTSSDKPTYITLNPDVDDLFHYDTIPFFNIVEQLFTLRVTVLNDATLLAFRVPHHFADGRSTFDIIEAYCNLISGKPIARITLPPHVPLSTMVHGRDELPPSVPANAPFIHPAENFTTGALSYVSFVGKVIYKVLAPKLGIDEPNEEKYIHLPASFVLDLQSTSQIQLDQAAKLGELKEGVGLTLTKNDVITAWLLRRSYAHVPADSSTPFDLIYNFNYRQALIQPEAGTNFIFNGFYNLRAHFTSIGELKTIPFYRVALAIRLCCIRNKQPSAVRTSLEFWEKNRSSRLSLAGPYQLDNLPNVSPWTTFGYNELDFSSALRYGEKGNGKVVLTVPCSMLPMRMMMKPFIMLMKDGQGGYWARVNLFKSWWDEVNEAHYM